MCEIVSCHVPDRAAGGEHREREGDETRAGEAGEEDWTTQLPCGQRQYAEYSNTLSVVHT